MAFRKVVVGGNHDVSGPSEPLEVGDDAVLRLRQSEGESSGFILPLVNPEPYSVSVVVDRNYGQRLHDLIESGPVWIRIANEPRSHSTDLEQLTIPYSSGWRHALQS